MSNTDGFFNRESIDPENWRSVDGVYSGNTVFSRSERLVVGYDVGSEGGGYYMRCYPFGALTSVLRVEYVPCVNLERKKREDKLREMLEYKATQTYGTDYPADLIETAADGVDIVVADSFFRLR